MRELQKHFTIQSGENTDILPNRIRQQNPAKTGVYFLKQKKCVQIESENFEDTEMLSKTANHLLSSLRARWELDI